MSNQLGSGLKPRHVTMISIAGVIGAGLFVGSATAIQLAGPAVLISYGLAGTLVVLVMRMLGEMATAHPDTGSFSTYADRAIGRWAGFSIGWLYWWFWVVVIPVEATAGAAILSSWTDWPQWVFALLITALLMGTNLFSVGNYGEFEFWFALVKVIAIVAFIAVGVLAMIGALPGSHTSGISHLWSNGFFADGFGGIIAAMLTTMFTFMGTEIVTIAAAESPDPVGGIRKAVNSVIWRISLFYLGSIFVVVALVSWKSPDLLENGSYQYALDRMGLGGLSTVLDIVVLTAVASCLNSALYTASRMAFSLSSRGDAPRAWSTTTSRGVPAWAIVVSTVVGFLGVIGNYLLPDKIFGYLLASSGAIALFVYIVIAASQLRMRRQLEDEGVDPPVRMWAFPWLTRATIAFIVVVLMIMAVRHGQRLELWLSVAVAAVIIGAGIFKHGLRGGDDQSPAAGVQQESADAP
ncbi:amino acid permease [Luteipulveratus mongoliensis]|uniref:GABA permease n=1 Tax=Luteipulveratus mongoliensis TaxID=571913 RepID=A0A0K1JH36_9MICO|nr:amino acid permease [Luteipulveratus mongoliensis]AKU15898.1 GABA permease [Luteipulveratus mongoliensis]